MQPKVHLVPPGTFHTPLTLKTGKPEPRNRRRVPGALVGAEFASSYRNY
ncbi:hypothetical protein R6138_04565 [Ralstonia thomasii]|nr:hypothetical protein R6138_04565 [Ralstonia sp. LMG 18095]